MKRDSGFFSCYKGLQLADVCPELRSGIVIASYNTGRRGSKTYDASRRAPSWNEFLGFLATLWDDSVKTLHHKLTHVESMSSWLLEVEESLSLN